MWEYFPLARFVESGPWWGAGFSDDVSHILVGARHGGCCHVMTRGFEMSVLDGGNTRSLTGSGWGCEWGSWIRGDCS